MGESKKITLKDYQNYLIKFCELAELHKKIKKSTHPNLPSLFSESLIKHLFSLRNVSRTDKYGDSKLKLNGKEIYFEIKGTSSNKGTTTIRHTKAKYIIWMYINLDSKKNEIGINLIHFNSDSLKEHKQYNITLGKMPFTTLLSPRNINEFDKVKKKDLSKEIRSIIKKTSIKS